MSSPAFVERADGTAWSFVDGKWQDVTGFVALVRSMRDNGVPEDQARELLLECKDDICPFDHDHGAGS